MQPQILGCQQGGILQPNPKIHPHGKVDVVLLRSANQLSLIPFCKAHHGEPESETLCMVWLGLFFFSCHSHPIRRTQHMREIMDAQPTVPDRSLNPLPWNQTIATIMLLFTLPNKPSSFSCPLEKIKIIGESGLPWQVMLVNNLLSWFPVYKHVQRRLHQCRPKPNLIKTLSINAQDTESNTLEMSSLRKTWGSFCLCHISQLCWISIKEALIWNKILYLGLVNSRR